MTPLIALSIAGFVGIVIGFILCAFCVRHEIEDIQHKEKIVENQRTRAVELMELAEKRESAVKGIAKATLSALDLVKRFVSESQRKEAGFDDACTTLNNLISDS
jgi:hypothetical protein